MKIVHKPWYKKVIQNKVTFIRILRNSYYIFLQKIIISCILIYKKEKKMNTNFLISTVKIKNNVNYIFTGVHCFSNDHHLSN